MVATYRILPLQNPIQTYPWGSRTALAEFLGRPSPAATPQAELWMGAHPKAPSQVQQDDGSLLALDSLIARDPESILGHRTAARFSNQLPYLFKILAAEQPLSIQAHPDQTQALAGFERENRAGIPLDAPQRNFKDPHHKPECICALTPFWAMCGFRPILEMLTLFSSVNSERLAPLLRDLEQSPDSTGLKLFFGSMLTMPAADRRTIIAQAVEKARPLSYNNPVFRWLTALQKSYPDDMGIFAPILLNLIRLMPGQALFLPAGELHAYLHGVAIELMANSDNVLRGGLTPKYIDVQELLKTLNFAHHKLEVLTPETRGRTEKGYPTLATEFSLSVITVQEGAPHTSDNRESVEILLCVEGAATLRQGSPSPPLSLSKGASVLIPAAAGEYTLSGKAVVYKASVP